jgi:intracellular multiplication protein IcmP
MPEQQQQSGQDSLEFLWMIGVFMGAAYLTWYFGGARIVSAVFYVRYYEIVAIDFVLGLIVKLMSLVGLPQPHFVLSEIAVFVRDNIHGVGVDFSTLMQVSAIVGDYMRYPLTLLMLGGAAFLHFSSASHKLRNVFDTKSLGKAEKENWPQIVPILGLDLVKQKIDDGPWAMALSPMNFCKKKDLLNVETQHGKYIATLKHGAAYRILSLQLGPKWYGVEALPTYLKALFAIFAARINGDKKSAEVLLDQINASATGSNFNFIGVKELLSKYVNSKEVVKITNLHGYVTTIFASMLVGARVAGVLATAEFLWLKPIDRRMWYMLNSVGRQTAVAEISGAFAHWLAEKKLGLPLTVPMIDEAIRGLELAVSEMIYKPDEEK